MQTHFSKILNNIFKYLTIFLLCFVWINFYIKNLTTSAIISLIITIFIGLLLEFINRKKQNKLNLKSAEKKLINESSYQFLFGDEITIKNFFINLLKSKYDVEQLNSNIIVKSDTQNTLFLTYYHTTAISTQDIIKAYNTAKKCNVNNVIIVCKTYDNESLNLASCVRDVTFNLLDENLTYKYILKPFNTYPNFSIELKNVEKLKYKEIKKLAFNKSKSKSYFLSGILLMFSSFFTVYNIYYVVMASVLFILALYSSFNTTHNKVDEKKLF